MKRSISERYINAVGPAQVLRQLFGIKAGEGPQLLAPEMVPIFDAYLRDPEYQSFYGIVAFNAATTVPAVAAQFSGITLLPTPVTGRYITVITVMQGVLAGSGLDWYLAPTFAGAITPVSAFARDSRVGSIQALDESTTFAIRRGNQAGAMTGSLVKRFSSTSSFNNAVLHPPPAAAGLVTGLGMQATTVNVAMDVNIEGYLIPLKAV